eukprot:jgi/Ulvmu1/12418/UM009_0068.1
MPFFRQYHSMNTFLRRSIALVGLLTVCWSCVSAQNSVTSPRCSPERSETSACVWTGDCDRAGCFDKCIANRGTMQSWYVLLDRAMGDEFYSACPALAFWVNNALAIQRSSGRRLLSKNDAAEHLKSIRMVRSPAKGVAKLERASRSLLNAADDDSTPPGNMPTVHFTADLPSNVCPTSAEIDEAAQSLAAFATIFRQIFEADASGQPIPSDLEDFSGLLTQPNTFQWLIAFLEDPDRLAEYISNNCVSKTIDDLESLQFTRWLESDDYELFLEQDDLSQVQCVDTFGAIDDFLRHYQSVLLLCDPPFGLYPDCFTVLGHFIVTSPTCATAYARMFNVTNATPLTSIAANVNNIQDACSAVTNEAECLSSITPALDTIEELHNSIPVLHELDLGSVAATGPVPEVSPVSFGGNPQSTLPGQRTGEDTAQIDILRDAGIKVLAIEQSAEAPAPWPILIEGGQGSELDLSPPNSTVDTAAVAGGVTAAAVVALLVVAFVIYRIKQKRTADVDGASRKHRSGAAGAADIAQATNSSILWLPAAGSTDASGRAITVGSKPAPPAPQAPTAEQGSVNLPWHGLPWSAPPSRPSQNGAPGSIGQHALQVTRRGLPGVTTAGEALSSVQSWATGRTVGFNPSELRVVPATTFTAGSNWSDYQRAATTTTSPLDALEVALDAMCSMQEPFYDRYIIRSSLQRRVGGQGLVQFASILNTEDKAAIKFYMDKTAFQRERDLYQEPQLNSMMPATLAIIENADGGCKTPYGYSFPPFVIIECGQSLDEWALANSKADFITIFQALSHSVRALQKLHSVGYAHRDIKPGNILRRYKEHDWTLIDFGCTSQIGTTANMAFTLKYAPPEVMHAMESGCRTIAVDSAVDMWAIGVIAYELLTRERAFPVDGLPVAEAEQKARDAIAGRTQLPWEVAAADGTDTQLSKMRFLRHTVLRCLDRDPTGRPSAAELLETWDHAFDDLQSPNRQS